MDDGFTPGDYFERSIKFWWILVISTLIGAGAGWLFTLIKTPVYESKSSITTAINYAETGFLSDTEEDHALSAVGDVLLSDSLLSDLRASLDANSLSGMNEELIEILFIEREGYRWTLRVRAESSQTAEQISKTWAEIALSYLNDSLDHARQGLILSRQMAELESCLSKSVSVIPSAAPCNPSGFGDLTDRLDVLGARYKEEKALSNGIIPSLVFSLNQSGAKAGLSATSQTAGLVFAGAMLGFLAGMIMILSGIPRSIFKVPVRGK